MIAMEKLDTPTTSWRPRSDTIGRATPRATPIVISGTSAVTTDRYAAISSRVMSRTETPVR